MATVQYLTKGKGDKSKIYIRFHDGRKTDFMRATKYEVLLKHWKSDKQRIGNFGDAVDQDKINSYLRKLDTFVSDRYLEDYNNGVTINSKWFKKLLLEFSNQDKSNEEIDLNLFVNYGEKFVSDLPYMKNSMTNDIGRSPRTILHYKNAIEKVRRFNAEILISEIDSTFETEFIKYLIEKENLAKGTVGRLIVFVKTICVHAQSKGVNVSLELHSIKGFSSKSSIVYLNEKEIESIQKYDFSKEPYLDNARDWLIVGLFTGQRVSDFMAFTKHNISNDGYLEFEQEKTEKKTVVPIGFELASILEKYDGNFPRKISHQRFNDYIKEVCKRAEIDTPTEGHRIDPDADHKRKIKGVYPKHELASSHICRRSFATNHYGKLPTPVLMSITNHSTEKMFLTYIGKTPKDHAEQLKEYWEQLRKNKHNEEPPMEVVKSQA